jgi:hypothetical protein
LMTWFKREEHSSAAIISMYVTMLLVSVALGALISRYFSEPLNRQLRKSRSAPQLAREWS